MATHKIWVARKSDVSILAELLHNSTIGNPFTAALFPDMEEKSRIENITTHLLSNIMLAHTIYILSASIKTNDVVAYSTWAMPPEVASVVRKESDSQLDEIDRDDAWVRACQEGNPDGLNVELAKSSAYSANKVVAPYLVGRMAIMLQSVSTHRDFRDKSHATEHIKWGIRLADMYRLPIWLRTPVSTRSLFAYVGFEEVGTVTSDLSLGSHGAGHGLYVHSVMVKEPTSLPTLQQQKVFRKPTAKTQAPSLKFKPYNMPAQSLVPRGPSKSQPVQASTMHPTFKVTSNNQPRAHESDSVSFSGPMSQPFLASARNIPLRPAPQKRKEAYESAMKPPFQSGEKLVLRQATILPSSVETVLPKPVSKDARMEPLKSSSSATELLSNTGPKKRKGNSPNKLASKKQKVGN